MREIPFGGKLLAQSLGRIGGVGALVRWVVPTGHEFGKRLERSETLFPLLLCAL